MRRRIHALLVACALAFIGATAHADSALERTSSRDSSARRTDASADGRWSLLDVVSLISEAHGRRGDYVRRSSVDGRKSPASVLATSLAIIALPALTPPPPAAPAAVRQPVRAPAPRLVFSSRTSRGPPART